MPMALVVDPPVVLLRAKAALLHQVTASRARDERDKWDTAAQSRNVGGA
jgi:hypothetical protein